MANYFPDRVMALQRTDGNGVRRLVKTGKVELKRPRLTGTDAEALVVPKKSKISKIGSKFPSSSARHSPTTG